MDPNPWTIVIGGIGSLSGVAALLKWWTDRHRNKGDLAVTLSATAKDWVQYIDGKFDEASKKADTAKSELAQYKSLQAAREAGRAVLHAAHHQWDLEMKNTVEQLTGRKLSDPPPLDVPTDPAPPAPPPVLPPP